MFVITRNPLVNFVLNFLVSLGLFWLFQQAGWIQINSLMPLWKVVAIVSLVSLLSNLLVIICALFLLPVLLTLSCCTFGLADIFINGALTVGVLLLTAQFTGLFTMPMVWWQLLTIGLAFSLLRFKAPRAE